MNKETKIQRAVRKVMQQMRYLNLSKEEAQTVADKVVEEVAKTQ